jgi:hypothetical protein
VLAEWNVAALGPHSTPRATQISQRLQLVQKVYDQDPRRRFVRWRPGAEAREHIRDAHSFQHAKLVRQRIKASLPAAASGTSKSFYTEHTPLTYSELRAKLYSLLAQSGEIPAIVEVKKALGQFRRHYQRDILDGMYAAAAKSTSPFDRAMITHSAELHEQWFETQAVVRAAGKVVAGFHPGVDWELNSDDCNERFRLNNMLLKMRRELLATGK